MQRNLYFDALRGIAIMMVVAIHTFYACEFDSWLSICAISMREIFNMAVPMFLAISGFFIGRRDFEDKRQVFAFWKKQIPKVYIPVLFWSIPYFFLSILEGQSILENVLLFFFCGYSIYYFIALIVQCYLLLPVIQKKMLKPATGGGGNPMYINNMRHCNFLYKCYKTSFNSVCRSCNCMVNILLVRSIYFKKQPKL